MACRTSPLVAAGSRREPEGPRLPARQIRPADGEDRTQAAPYFGNVTGWSLKGTGVLPFVGTDDVGQRRCTTTEFPILPWAHTKCPAKGSAKTAGFRKAPAECNFCNAFIRQARICELLATIGKGSIEDRLRDGQVCCSTIELLKIARRDADRPRNLIDRQFGIMQIVQNKRVSPIQSGDRIPGKFPVFATQRRAHGQGKVTDCTVGCGREEDRLDHVSAVLQEQKVLTRDGGQRLPSSEGSPCKIVASRRDVAKAPAFSGCFA
jgi:hypothetical protein